MLPQAGPHLYHFFYLLNTYMYLVLSTITIRIQVLCTSVCSVTVSVLFTVFHGVGPAHVVYVRILFNHSRWVIVSVFT